MSTTHRSLLMLAILAAAAGCGKETEAFKDADKAPSQVSAEKGLPAQAGATLSKPRVMSQYAISDIAPSRTKVQGSMMGGTGSRLIPSESELDSLRRDHVASFDISEDAHGSLTLSTSEADDKLWFEMESLTSLKTIVPSGAGSTYRFHGKVSSFLPGYTFAAESAAPMVFTLTADSGLKFVRGKGKVSLPNGKEVVLDSGQ